MKRLFYRLKYSIVHVKIYQKSTSFSPSFQITAHQQILSRLLKTLLFLQQKLRMLSNENCCEKTFVTHIYTWTAVIIVIPMLGHVLSRKKSEDIEKREM